MVRNVRMEGKTLQYQLDAGAYACVIDTIQLQQIAPKATIKPTSQTLVSYSQHGITPIKFYIIDNKQKAIHSGKACQALSFIQKVHKTDTSLQELLDQ